jgi:predicted amidophosphoribosyltransferase
MKRRQWYIEKRCTNCGRERDVSFRFCKQCRDRTQQYQAGYAPRKRRQLTNDEMEFIASNREIPAKELAEKFGVHVTMIYYIWRKHRRL